MVRNKDKNNLDTNDDDIRIDTYTIYFDNGSCLTISSDDDSKTINKFYNDLKTKGFVQFLRNN